MRYYPAFLSLSGRKVVVVGGGSVGERKVLPLIKAGATVTVVEPFLTKRLEHEVESGRLRHIARRYRKGDLRGAFLVIAATDSPETNARVARHAPGLVNVVDVPAQCSFIVPSVVSRGPLTIAISTSGASPAVSRAVRMELEQSYGPAFSKYLAFVRRIRMRAMVMIPDQRTRERFLKTVGSTEMLAVLRNKGLPSARESILRAFSDAAGVPQRRASGRKGNSL